MIKYLVTIILIFTTIIFVLCLSVTFKTKDIPVIVPEPIIPVQQSHIDVPPNTCSTLDCKG
jgi:hypothetical protein